MPSNIKSILIKRYYKTMNFDRLKSKHYPPAIKEWNNSVYNYNNKNMFDTTLRDNIVKNFIKSYFNLVPTPNVITKSERMRTLIRRSSTKGIFVSKPEIKQTNEKVIITVYIFDRDKQLNRKKLFYIKKWFIKNNNNNILNSIFNIYNQTRKRSDFIKNLVSDNYGMLYKKFMTRIINRERKLFNLKWKKKQRKRYSRIRRVLKKEFSSFYLRNNYYSRFFSKFLLKNKSLLNNIFIFTFLKWALSVFRIKIIFLVARDNKGKRIKNKNLKLLIKKGINEKILFNKAYINSNDINIVNLVLLKYLIANLKKVLPSTLNQKDSISLLFKHFKENNHNKFLKTRLRKRLLGINYLNKFYLSIFKHDRYLPFLKTFVKKIYSKKIEFNLVNQKYLHMNADTFSDAISIKLRRKKGKLLRILRKSMRLVKIFKLRENILRKVNSYKHLSNNDIFYELFQKMFIVVKRKKSKKSKGMWSTNNSKILSLLRYKWTTEVRVEAKGRLTRRFTASRALFKFKYKGNLKNLDNLFDGVRNPDKPDESPKIFMFRGELRPNIQHTFSYSNKRIGTFGVKGWISGN